MPWASGMALGLASQAKRSGISLGALGGRIVPLDHLAGISGHAAQHRGEAAAGAVMAFHVFLVFADRVDQVLMFLNHGVEAPFVSLLAAWAYFHSSPPVTLIEPLGIGRALGAVDRFRHAAAGIGNLAALAVELAAVRVGEFDEVVVEDLAHALLRVAALVALDAGAHAVGLDGMVALDPVADVDVVDVLLDDVVAAEPDEVVPVADLVDHFGHFRFPIAEPDSAAVPVAAAAAGRRRSCRRGSVARFPRSWGCGGAGSPRRP